MKLPVNMGKESNATHNVRTPVAMVRGNRGSKKAVLSVNSSLPHSSPYGHRKQRGRCLGYRQQQA